MNFESCKQIERQLRKLGYVPKDAIRYSRFLFNSILSVSGIIDSLYRKTWHRSLCDETPRSFLHMPAMHIVAIQEITGTGIILGPRVVETSARSSGLRRH